VGGAGILLIRALWEKVTEGMGGSGASGSFGYAQDDRSRGWVIDGRERFALCANAHLSDDEAVAKMGHPVTLAVMQTQVRKSGHGAPGLVMVRNYLLGFQRPRTLPSTSLNQAKVPVGMGMGGVTPLPPAASICWRLAATSSVSM